MVVVVVKDPPQVFHRVGPVQILEARVYFCLFRLFYKLILSRLISAVCLQLTEYKWERSLVHSLMICWFQNQDGNILQGEVSFDFIFSVIIIWMIIVVDVIFWLMWSVPLIFTLLLQCVGVIFGEFSPIVCCWLVETATLVVSRVIERCFGVVIVFLLLDTCPWRCFEFLWFWQLFSHLRFWLLDGEFYSSRSMYYVLTDWGWLHWFLQF